MAMTAVRVHLQRCNKLCNFVHPTLPVSFEKYTKKSLQLGVYASKISHTGGKCVICRGLTARWSLSPTHKWCEYIQLDNTLVTLCMELTQKHEL